MPSNLAKILSKSFTGEARNKLLTFYVPELQECHIINKYREKIELCMIFLERHGEKNQTSQELHQDG